MRLAGRCAEAERQVEAWRNQAEVHVEHHFEKAELELMSRHAQARAVVDRELAVQTEKAQQDYEAAVEAAQDRLERQLSANEQRTEQAQRSAKEELDEILWEADSIYEGAKERLRRFLDDLQRGHTTQFKALEQLKDDARSTIMRYKVSPPAPAAEAEMLARFPAPAPPEPGVDAATLLQRYADEMQYHLGRLRNLSLPALFVGPNPWLTVSFVVGVSLVATGLTKGWTPSAWLVGVPAGACAATLLFGWILKGISRRGIYKAYLPICAALEAARSTVRIGPEQAERAWNERVALIQRQRDASVAAAHEKYDPLIREAEANKSDRYTQMRDQHTNRLSSEEQKREDVLAEIKAERLKRYDELKATHDAQLAELKAEHDRQTSDVKQQYAQRWEELEAEWKEGVAEHYSVIRAASQRADELFPAWSDPRWNAWEPPSDAAELVSVGRLDVDLTQTSGGVPTSERLHVDMPTAFTVPVTLSLPERCSLTLRAGREGRDIANDMLATAMTRLLTALPPGQAHFTIIDPVGLGQNFAGFMHLADYEEALVGPRIWTETSHIETRLTDLTEHMENVIQKYLRNEFNTIDEYNAQAGELAEPYRYLVIADFPVNFNDEAVRRLASIVQSGPRCGVYTLMAMDTRQRLAGEFDVSDFVGKGLDLVYDGGRFAWNHDVFSQFPLSLDGSPPDELLSKLLKKVGDGARHSRVVEVPFERIAPDDEHMWTGDCSKELRVPIGRSGATRTQELSFGKGVAQHALVGGKTGSGKSTLLHALVTNLALWYSPDQVEFYLVDFKKGVEFKTYAMHDIPHARAVAIESDREFGLSVLHRIDAEMNRRGDLFRKLGVQDINGYRHAAPDKPLPRTLLIIDEFQEFFSEDDKLAQDSMLLLDRLVRQGRAFGIHVLLGSQTLAGTYSLSRSTLGQMAVRIALQCSEADAELIMSDGNSAARLLNRPGEAIYNDSGGLVEGNSPFQIAWLPDEQRTKLLEKITDRAREEGYVRVEPLIVFEGNVPADITKNRPLNALLDGGQPASIPAAPQAWLGEPIAIKAPTGGVLRRHAAANMMIIGQRDEAALAMTATSIVGLAAQHPTDGATFYILDGSSADAPHAGYLQHLADALPHQAHVVPYRQVGEALVNIAAAMQDRHDRDVTNAPAIYLIVFGLQRYRDLRPSEDDFGMSTSFSSFDDDKEAAPPPPKADKLFAEILRDGPPVGVHTIAWCDSPTTLERTVNRQAMREFDMRVLFQMSGTDSANLVDSPVASNLGMHRAIYYSEEKGILEKFRPYALPPQSWIDHVGKVLTNRPTMKPA